ncbi:MAG TPA: glycosyltransferase [Gemmatimonadaceae bacterium]|nr:glycosyltransferase [Gemmatimonadaceae bacterium]
MERHSAARDAPGDLLTRVRIAYLTTSAQMGGAERCLLDVLEGIRVARPEWSLLLVSPGDGPVAVRARALGVEVVVLPFPRALASVGDAAASGSVLDLVALGARGARAVIAARSYERALRDVVREACPDLVHSNGLKMHVLSARSVPDVPIVWHLHDYTSMRRVMARALRRLAPRARMAIAVSSSVGDDARRVFGDRLPVRVVYNGVNVDEFAPDGPAADLDALAGLDAAPTGAVRIGLVATFGRFKGHDVFLRALAQLPRDASWRAYVVGGPVYETRGSEFAPDSLRELARELGIADRVGFTGFVAAPADAMRALDVVVHATTVAEPFGLVIAEGMACARAVVASAGGGAAEIVDDGVNALAHVPGDAAGLSRALERLIGNANLRASLGAAARRTAEARFDRRRVSAALIPIYEQLANGERACP